MNPIEYVFELRKKDLKLPFEAVLLPEVLEYLTKIAKEFAYPVLVDASIRYVTRKVFASVGELHDLHFADTMAAFLADPDYFEGTKSPFRA